MDRSKDGAQANLYRAAAAFAWATTIVSIFAIVTLVVFFATFDLTWGTINDTLIAVWYALMMPLAIMLHALLRSHGADPGRGTLAFGLAGMVTVAVLSVLLVLRIVPFVQQVGPVSIAFVVVLAWFVMLWRSGRQTALVPRSLVLHVLAGLVVGYPLWAFLVARRLLAEKGTPEPTSPGAG